MDILYSLLVSLLLKLRASVWVTSDVGFVALFFHQIVDFSTKSSLVNQKLFYFVALLAFENYFHFGSDTSDYNDAKLILDENKHSIITR